MRGYETSVEIKFRYDDRYRSHLVEDDNPNAWIQIPIQIGDEYIYREEGVTGYACTAVLNLLQSIEAIRAGETFTIEFEFGPTWLVIEPVDTTTIRVAESRRYSGVDNPSKRLDIDVACTVARDRWVAEVIEVTDDFIEQVVSLNPEVDDSPYIVQLRGKLDQVTS